MPGSSDLHRLHNRVAALADQLSGITASVANISDRLKLLEDELLSRESAERAHAANGTDDDRCPICGLRYNDKRHKPHSTRPARPT